MAKINVSTKRCCTCKETKSVSEFWKNKKAKDGLQFNCKACCKKAKKRWYNADPEHAKAVGRAGAIAYLRREKGLARRRATQKLPETKAYFKRYAKAYYDQKLRGTLVQKARDAVGSAIRSGKLPPAKTLTCSQCGKSARSYHHHQGYDPEHHLHVIPVCAFCHKRLDSPYVQPGSAGVRADVRVQHTSRCTTEIQK